MRAQRLRKGLTAAGLGAALAFAPAAGADEPGLFGRLFRMGGSNASKGNAGKPASPFGEKPGAAAGRDHDHNHDRDPGGDAFIPPASPRGGVAPRTAAPPPAAPLPLGGGPSTPEVADAGPAPTITPRSRVSSAATEADPLLTRMALGRSNDGGKFGMFMQVYADGTVIDSEGVHRLSPADVKPLADLVASGELGRNRGHCGSPSGDYIEEVHVVVFERRLGRLTAQPFSYSGNPQGCDPSVRQLHAVIDNLQLRLSGQPAAVADASGVPAPVVAPADLAAPAPEAAPLPAAAPVMAAPRGAVAPRPGVVPGAGRVLPPLGEAPAAPSGPVIPLTPADPR
ncbi:MAG: hypothetical protein BGO49_17725 [Planctomycetales bacterium 71-10]|nr:MAG: hypothetical protein BGO49_17725 [Planctomycetales bacterium 71-10]